MKHIYSTALTDLNVKDDFSKPRICLYNWFVFNKDDYAEHYVFDKTPSVPTNEVATEYELSPTTQNPPVSTLQVRTNKNEQVSSQ